MFAVLIVVRIIVRIICEWYRFGLLRGHHSAQFDCNLQPCYMDIMLWQGWLSCVQLMRRAAPGSLVPWATKCSSWIWIVRHVTKRSALEPLGPAEDAHHAVVEGNTMVSRVSACQNFLNCLGDVVWTQEQPTSSLMGLHPRQQDVKSDLDYPPSGQIQILGQYNRVHTWQSAFGAPTPKSTSLVSNSAHILCLKRSLTRAEIRALSQQTATYTKNELRAAAGLPCITGKPKELSQTAVYPPLFADCGVRAWEVVSQKWASRILRANTDLPMPDNLASSFSDVWEDLDLRSFANMAGIPHDVLIV